MAGEVKIFDMVNSAGTVQTDATLAESNYTRITSLEHSFSGMLLIDNSIIRVALWNPNKTGAIGSVPMYCYVNGTWTRHTTNTTRFQVDSVYTDGRLISFRILENSHTRVRVEFTKNYKEGSVDRNVTWTITVRRGSPTALFETSDAGWSHVSASVDSSFFYYSSETTFKDSADPNDTKTETWSMSLKKGVGFVVPVISSKQKIKGYFDGLTRIDSSNDLKWVTIALLPLTNSDQGGADGGVWHKECENETGTIGTGESGTWNATADAAASAGDMLANATPALNHRKNFQMYVPWKGYYRLGIQSRNESVTSGHNLEVILQDGSDTTIETIGWNTNSTAYELKMSRPFMIATVSPIIGLKTTGTVHTWKLDQIVLIPIGRTKDSPAESMWPAEIAHEPLAGVELVARDITNE